jgi:hypothetical protein
MRPSTLAARLLASAAATACAVALGSAAASAATGVPAAPTVPGSFQPVSASFVSSARGWVLGTVGCQRRAACRAQLAATTDGGARWQFVTVPKLRLFDPAGDQLTQASRVSDALFTSRQDGWLYGPGLYATHDGGSHWSRIALGGSVKPSQGGGVVAMAASAATVYALVSPDPFRAAPEELYASPAGRNAWARVGTMTGNPLASLAVSGTAAWFGAGDRLWATADGVHWHQYRLHCPAGYGLAGISAASRSRVAFLCTDPQGMFQTPKAVLVSVNGGQTQRLAGHAPTSGDTGQIAVPPGAGQVITIPVITPGPDYLARSADGGRIWAEITIRGTDGGVNLNSLSYVSPVAGWLVVGSPLSGGSQLLRTNDAGRGWHPVRF